MKAREELFDKFSLTEDRWDNIKSMRGQDWDTITDRMIEFIQKGDQTSDLYNITRDRLLRLCVCHCLFLQFLADLSNT